MVVLLPANASWTVRALQTSWPGGASQLNVPYLYYPRSGRQASCGAIDQVRERYLSGPRNLLIDTDYRACVFPFLLRCTQSRIATF